jgi:hypothetical protein|tara:strand:+ start:979 stop:1164 length:186 start_codon:yes stop_codon:yes gene_type:complete
MDIMRLTTEQLKEKYDVIGFGYGYVAVRDKVTNEEGSFDFDHSPRVYYNYLKSDKVRFVLD